MSPATDESELVRIYRATIQALYCYVSRRVGGDRALAEDLVQDTWMRALDAWAVKGLPQDPLAWLTRVAHNTLVSYFRRIKPQLVDPAALELPAAPFEPDAPDSAAIVAWGLARLRRRHSDLLEAFYFDEKSVRQIAAERSLSERAVEGRLRRARLLLKRILNQLAPASSPAGRLEAKRGPEHVR